MQLTDKQLIESGLLGFTFNDFHEVKTKDNRIEQILIIDCPYFKTYDGHKRWVIRKSYYDNKKYELVNYEYFMNEEGHPSYLPLSFLIGSDVTFSIVNKHENKINLKKANIPLLVAHNETGELIRNPQIFSNSNNSNNSNSNNSDNDKTIKKFKNEDDLLIERFARFFMDFIFPNIHEVERIYQTFINENFDETKLSLGDAYDIVQLMFPDTNEKFITFDQSGKLSSALQTII